MESGSDSVILDTLILDRQHIDAEDASNATMVKKFKLRFFRRREIPCFAAPKEDGEDAEFVDHCLCPHLQLWALPKNWRAPMTWVPLKMRRSISFFSRSVQ